MGRDTPLILLWRGVGTPRMEVARVDRADGLRARGVQLGFDYGISYDVDGERLRVETVGVAPRVVELELGECDFFDVGYSPLFNSLPVLRDGLLERGAPRDYAMWWVDVPSLDVRRSEQRYEPLGGGRIRFASGSFEAELELDGDGFVVRYPGLAERVDIHA